MDGPGPFTSTTIAGVLRAGISDHTKERDGGGKSSSMSLVSPTAGPKGREDNAEQLLFALHITDPLPTERCPPRISYLEFASKYRTYKEYERKTYILQRKLGYLQKSISLSARLTRVGSWIHDGLVEISDHSESNGFVRLYQHMKDLADVCFTHWNQEMQELEDEFDIPIPLEEPKNVPSSEVQKGLLDFVENVRSNPRFIVDRLRNLSIAQIAALFPSPRFRDFKDASFSPLVQGNWGKVPQRNRIKTYSRVLEDHATSFERSHPLSFLLYNCFGPTIDLNSAESQLRFSTWSTVGATLYLEHNSLYDAFMPSVFRAFAHLEEWKAKNDIELFLMDVLQRGSFLLHPANLSTDFGAPNVSSVDNFETPQALEFFDTAVRNLLFMLANHHEPIPAAPLRLCQKILRKLGPRASHSRLRGAFFFEWFWDDFLLFNLQYPENEKIMLNFHITSMARRKILLRLWRGARTIASELFTTDPPESVDVEIRNCVLTLIQNIDDDSDTPTPEAPDHTRPPEPKMIEPKPLDFVTVCTADAIHTIEALRPQKTYSSGPLDPIVKLSTETFNAQYFKPNEKFEKLYQLLLQNTESGFSSNFTHPCQETWVTFSVGANDNLEIIHTRSKESFLARSEQILGKLDLSQAAVLRLSQELSTSDVNDIHIADHLVSNPKSSLLSKFFDRKAVAAVSQASSVNGHYWHQALQHLWRVYPSSHLNADDSRVLAPLQRKVLQLGQTFIDQSAKLSIEVTGLEKIFRQRKKSIGDLVERLDLLRTKMWYMVGVINSREYEDARNLSGALNNMGLLGLLNVDRDVDGLSVYSRPEITTQDSYVFDQARLDTMSILKAPTNEGGPKKLAESQISRTKNWLARNKVSNICTGEERIHRFCMEIMTTVNKIIGENLNDNRILWSSELFHREKVLFDIQTTSGGSQYGSRSPSVMSDPLSSSTNPTRPHLRLTDNGLRWMASAASLSPARKTSYFSLTSNRGNRELGSEVGSSIGSPERSNTASTGGTATSLWSQTNSGTSASLVSRASSIYNEYTPVRSIDSGKGRKKFLEKLKEALICLLLSDLGCLVWSCGTETDGWMDKVQDDLEIAHHLRRRRLTARLASASGTVTASGHRNQYTSDDTADEVLRRASTPENPSFNSDATMFRGQNEGSLLFNEHTVARFPNEFPFKDVFARMLTRIGQQINPMLKLREVHELEQLVISFVQHRQQSHSPKQPDARKQARRHSLDSQMASADHLYIPDNDARSQAVPPEDAAVTQCLQQILQEFRPKTIFRDLQYIAALVPGKSLEQTPAGQAFLRFGLAALSHKNELCRTLVDIADSMMSDEVRTSHVVKAPSGTAKLLRVAEFWIIAAKEGNAVAQRELAGLYLSRPDVLPVVSMPLYEPSSIFRQDRKGEAPSEDDERIQALCLALHWMQQAKHNGDELARKKLEEMERDSIRR